MLKLGGKGGQGVQVDTKHAAMRVSLRPLDIGALGAYRLSVESGSIAATLGANSDIFGVRWTDATKKLVLHELAVGVYVDGNVTASLLQYLAAYIARTWSVAFSTNNTAITPSKVMASHANSAADVEMCTTAAMGGSTKTVDTNPFARTIPYMSGTTAPAFSLPKSTIYRSSPGQEHPIVLGQNEGIVIRNPLAGPVTGTFKVAVDISWSEVASYEDALL